MVKNVWGLLFGASNNNNFFRLPYFVCVVAVSEAKKSFPEKNGGSPAVSSTPVKFCQTTFPCTREEFV